MAGLTQPLEFRKFMVRGPRPGFDFVPFLDAMLIALFVALNTSAFVSSPGALIQLPTSPSVLGSQADPTAVLTVDRNQLYFFEGLKLPNLGMDKHLRAFVDEHTRRTGKREATLLIKADASIQTEVLFHLLDIARQAGFTRVQLAAEPDPSSSDERWEESPNSVAQ